MQEALNSMPIDIYQAQAQQVPDHRRQADAVPVTPLREWVDKAAETVVAEAAKDGQILIQG